MTSVAMDLLPNDVFAENDDAPSPFELLQFQAQRIAERSNGRLRAEITTTESDDRHVENFVLILPTNDYRCTLFQVVHRPDFFLPVRFLPPEPLPKYLQKREDTFANFNKSLRGGSVDDPWRASTPHEFKTVLQELLRSEEVRAVLSALVERAKQSNNITADAN